MKFNIEVEIDYLSGSGKLDERLEKKIVNEVVNEIWDTIKDDVEEGVQKVSEERVKHHLDEKIQKEASILVKTGKLNPTSRYYKGPENPTIEEYIQYLFSKKSKIDITENLKEEAKKISKKLEDKYDMVFAQQIILKMRDQDLLKDNVETALFESKLKDD